MPGTASDQEAGQKEGLEVGLLHTYVLLHERLFSYFFYGCLFKEFFLGHRVSGKGGQVGLNS